MTDETTPKTASSGKKLEIQWLIPPGPEIYVNQLLAQYDGDVVHLMFAQVTAPAMIEKTEAEKEEILAKLPPLPAIPIGRFVVPVESFRRMVKVLQEHLKKISTS
jgi:hypothetical protein